MTETAENVGAYAERLADAELTHRVAQFFYHEAELLDDGRFADWLEIFDDDLFYWAPLRTNRLRRQAALSVGVRRARLRTSMRRRNRSRGASAATTPAWPGPKILHRARAT